MRDEELIKDGKVSGYSGIGGGPRLPSDAWVERTRQVANDVGRGYVYFARVDGAEVRLQRSGNQSVSASLDGHDLLADLPDAGEQQGMDVSWLELLEANPDLYLRTRPPPAPSR